MAGGFADRFAFTSPDPLDIRALRRASRFSLDYFQTTWDPPFGSGSVDSSRMDTSTLPKDFLELYPYPALVLVAPIPPGDLDDTADPDDPLVPPESHHIPFTRSTHSASSTFDPVWANEKWRNLMQNHRLLDSISISTARKLGNWVAGNSKLLRKAGSRRGSATVPRPPSSRAGQPPAMAQRPIFGESQSEMQVEQALVSPRTMDEAPPPPEGFWEPEIPYEDRTNGSEHSLSESGLTGIEDADEETAGPATLTIEINEPVHVKLDLTQTRVPIYQFGRTGARTRMETHTFVIITTVPRSELVPNRIGSQIGESSPMASRSRNTTSTFVPSSRGEASAIPADNGLLAPQSFFPALPRTSYLHSPSSPVEQRSMLPQSATGIIPRDLQITPTDEIMALDLSASGETTDRPLMFNKDGVVSRLKGSRTSGVDDRGKSLDVMELLETYDWSSTSLGPKDQWPQSLKTVGE